MVTHWAHNPEMVGSIPTAATTQGCGLNVKPPSIAREMWVQDLPSLQKRVATAI